MKDFKNGSVKISNDVIDQLIGEIALRVDGVVRVSGYMNNALDKVSQNKIRTQIEGKNLSTVVTVTLKQEYKLIDVAENIQKEIKKQIKTMLGLNVDHVHVRVKNIKTKEELKTY